MSTSTTRTPQEPPEGESRRPEGLGARKKRRIDELAEAEELGAMRPELDGNRIQEVLGISPGREVGEAYRFLLEVRLDEGVIGPDAAEQRLREWWAARG